MNKSDSIKAPFPVEYIEWKPEATTQDKTRALAVPYADIRAYEDRLNEMCDGWSNSIYWLTDENKIVCTVTLDIEGISRSNVGESSLGDKNAATIAYAQAFKRACSSFGLGRYLYDVPTAWVAYDGDRKKITDDALSQLRRTYERFIGQKESAPQTTVKFETNGKMPSEPANITELYQMAKERFGHEHTKHTLNIMQSYLDEQHGGGTIKAYLQMEPGNIKVLWSVIVEHEEAKAAELEE